VEVVVTIPRRVVKGQVVAVVRRTLERRGLLRPEPWVKLLFAYAVALAQEKTGMHVLAFEAMSNHIHLVVEDVDGRLPDFMKELDELVAKAVNAERQRRDTFWEGAGAKWTVLLTPEAIEESVAYTILNCVDAGLVADAKAWGGFVTLPTMLAREQVVERPKLRYFSERSKAPATAVLRIDVPSAHATLGPDGWQRLIAKRVAAGEDEIRLRVGKGQFAGMEAVLARSVDWRPSTEEALGSPTPAAKAGNVAEAKVLIKAFRTLRAWFLNAYRLAYDELRQAGTTVFPEGTWRWHHEARLPCSGPPTEMSAAA